MSSKRGGGGRGNGFRRGVSGDESSRPASRTRPRRRNPGFAGCDSDSSSSEPLRIDHRQGRVDSCARTGVFAHKRLEEDSVPTEVQPSQIPDGEMPPPIPHPHPPGEMPVWNTQAQTSWQPCQCRHQPGSWAEVGQRLIRGCSSLPQLISVVTVAITALVIYDRFVTQAPTPQSLNTSAPQFTTPQSTTPQPLT